MRSTLAPSVEWSLDYHFNDEPVEQPFEGDDAPSNASSPSGPAGLDNGELYYVYTDGIRVGSRLRDLDEGEIARLQESLSERGLLHPLLIRYDQGCDDLRPVLVGGAYRLEAARRLGWRQILCRVIQASEIESQLIEIDENVARVDLSPAAHAIYLGRRHELYERLHGPAKARGAHKANAAMGNANAAANLAPAFATATAAVTGLAERSVQRGVARAATLGPDLLKRLAGTSLDRGTELDALAALPLEARDELVERAVAGKQVSAAATLKKSVRASLAPATEKIDEPAKSPDPIATGEPEKPDMDLEARSPHSPDDRAGDTCDTLTKLQQDWLGATVHARVLFLNWVVAGWTGSEDRR